jgi:hypothetical protein
LLGTVFAVFLFGSMLVAETASVGEYDPWVDLNDDGKIDIYDVALAARLFGTTGEPFVAKAAIEYDSGWTDITDKAGQYFNITHNLNTTNIIVDIQGKTTPDSGPHQKHLGLTAYIPGWTKTYGGTDYDYAYAIVQTGDGGYALAGYTYSFGAGGADFWLVKTDASGNVQWTKTYGGIYGDRTYAMVQTGDGGYALAGYTYSFGAGGADFWLVKTSVESGLAWVDSTLNTITLYKGSTDAHWNYVRVIIWKIKETP